MDIKFGRFTRKDKDTKKDKDTRKKNDTRKELVYRSTNESQREDISFRVVFLGEVSIGAKTCFIIRYVRGVFDNSTSATIGAEFYSKNVNLRGRNVTVEIWDTNGSERAFSLAPMYIRDSAGVVMGYDITNRESFYIARQRMMDIKEKCPVDKKVFMLIGNKVDLESERQVSHEEGEELARELDIPLFFETSAKTGYNVNESMDVLVNMILDMIG